MRSRSSTWPPVTERVSSETRTLPGTTLIRHGCVSSSPVVPTVVLPISLARRSTSRIVSAAGIAASTRKSIGVAPAWSARPVKWKSPCTYPGRAWTTPMRLPVSCSTRPCSIWTSIQPVRPSISSIDSCQRSGSYPAAFAESQKEVPSGARIVVFSSSSVTRCSMIREPSSIWPKPEPSSSRKLIRRSGMCWPDSCARRQTSSAVTTPRVPSYLPPLRLESQCEPMPNAGAPLGTLEATSVPTGSRQTSKPIFSSSRVKYCSVFS